MLVLLLHREGKPGSHPRFHASMLLILNREILAGHTLVLTSDHIRNLLILELLGSSLVALVTLAHGLLHIIYTCGGKVSLVALAEDEICGRSAFADGDFNIPLSR